MRKLMTMLLGLSLVGGSAMFAAPKKSASKTDKPKEVQKSSAAAKAAKAKAKSTPENTQK